MVYEVCEAEKVVKIISLVESLLVIVKETPEGVSFFDVCARTLRVMRCVECPCCWA